MVGHEVFISQMKDQIRILQKQNRPIMTYFYRFLNRTFFKAWCPKYMFFDGGYIKHNERSLALY